VVVFESGTSEMYEYRYEKADLAESCQWWQERLRASLNELPSQWLEKAFARAGQRRTETIPITG
jgi:putative proteasome-type protease